MGLLVHSAADGFAVGASSVSTSASLSFLVAMAMVLHKVLISPRRFLVTTRAHLSSRMWMEAKEPHFFLQAVTKKASMWM